MEVERGSMYLLTQHETDIVEISADVPLGYLHTYIYYWALWKCRKFRNWNSKKMTTYLAVGVNFF